METKQEKKNLKTLFVIDFDGTIIINEFIVASNKESALEQMRGLNLNMLHKVLTYLHGLGHYTILGSLKSLWDNDYQNAYYEKYGRKNTCDECGTTTFCDYRQYMLDFMDHHFGVKRSFLTKEDQMAFAKFDGWPVDLKLKDKKRMMEDALTYAQKKYPEIDTAVLVDDDKRYAPTLSGKYRFLFADPKEDKKPENRNIYLLKMLTAVHPVPVKQPTYFKPSVNLEQLEQQALKKLADIDTIDNGFIKQYILPLKSAYAIAQNDLSVDIKHIL